MDTETPVCPKEGIDAVRRLRLLAEHSRDVLCEVHNGVITYISENATAISGRGPDEFVGQKFTDVVHPDDRPALARYFAAGWTGPIAATFRILDAAGDWSWREARGGRIVDESGDYSSVLVLRDISERMTLGQELRQGEQRSRAMIAAIPDLVFRMSRDGSCIDYKADRAEDLYVPREALIGGNIRTFLPPDVGLPAPEMIHRTLDIGGVHTMYYSLVKGGQLLDYKARFAASGDDEVVVICRDVTKRNCAEDALRDTREQAAVLRERARIAQELHDNVAQFFFGIGIAAKDAIERKSLTPATLRRRLKRIRALSVQGGREIRNAIEALAPPNLTDKLDAAIERLLERVRESTGMTASYANNLPGSVPEIISRELYAAAREALNNVVKHASATTISLRITATEGTASLEVRDDGSGSAAAVANASSGFGLQSLRQRFRSHHGRIDFEDASPRGLIVRFVLPCAVADRAA